MCFSQPKIPKPPPAPAPPPAPPLPTADYLEQDPRVLSAQQKAAKLGLSQLRIPVPGVGGLSINR